MHDKHNNPLKVGDLIISDYRASAGQIYRIKKIEKITHPTDYQVEWGRSHQADCIRVFDRFLSPKDRGNFCTWGSDIIKVDKKYVSEMISRWSKLLTEEFSG